MIIVYYDGKCGLCSREITHYRHIAPAGLFEWQDITLDTRRLEARGIDKLTIFKALHVEDADGKLHVGVDAFLLIWKTLGGLPWGLMARLGGSGLLRPFAELGYAAFAWVRFKTSPQCQLVLTEAQTKS